MAKKQAKALRGSHPATLMGAEALRQLLKVRMQQAVLKRRAAMLRSILTKEGGGTAHGYRAYITPVKEIRYTRTVTVKAHDKLVLVKL